MMRLKSKLLSLNASKPIEAKIYSPANTEELRIPFRSDKMAKVVGKLAQISPPKFEALAAEQLISGVLVQNDFKLSLMAPEDLREYAGLTTTTIMCKQRLTLSTAGIELIRWALESAFGAIEDLKITTESHANGDSVVNGDGTSNEPADEEVERYNKSFAYLVMGCVEVHYENQGEITVQWEGNTLNDGIADAVLAVLFTVETSPAAVKRKHRISQRLGAKHTNIILESSKNHSHDHSNHHHRNPHANITPQERFERLCMFLEAQFGQSINPISKPKLPNNTAPNGFGPTKSSDSSNSNGTKKEPTEENEVVDTDRLAELEAAELDRLHGIGIPVPGIEIKVDKYVARIWLETLEVECASQVFAQRVKAVVDRAVETVAPLWEESKMQM